MVSNLLAMALPAMASNLMASNLAMASNLLATGSNLLAMASTPRNGLQPTNNGFSLARGAPS